MSKFDSSLSNPGMTRRKFLYYSALAAAGASALRTNARPTPRTLNSTDKLRIACVGAGGKGESDVALCGGEVIVAMCDLDEERSATSRRNFPNAKFYVDWREML